MRKILIGLALLSIVAAPMAVLAADPGGPQECCKIRRAMVIEGETIAKGDFVGPTTETSCIIGDNTKVTKGSSNWGAICLMNTFNAIVDWMFTIFVVLAVFFTILGAFDILMAGGNAEKVTSGRQYILYAAIGLAVAFIARAIPGLVKGILGF